MSTLCRAFVYLPNHLRTPEHAERTVFFEAPIFETRYLRLANLLALVWHVPAASMLEEGVIYNLATERELFDEHALGSGDTGDLRLLEIAWGGSDGIGPHHIHYQRAAHVDVLCAPRNAARLLKAMAQVEALYAAEGGAA